MEILDFSDEKTISENLSNNRIPLVEFCVLRNQRFLACPVEIFSGVLNF